MDIIMLDGDEEDYSTPVTIATTTTTTTTHHNDDHDCVLVAHYTRDDMDQHRRHHLEQGLHASQEHASRVTDAYSALSSQFEAVSNALAEEREHRQELQNDVRRFMRMRDDAQVAHANERAADIARTIALEQANVALQLTADQHRHMACPVCLELYVELGNRSELIFFNLFLLHWYFVPFIRL